MVASAAGRKKDLKKMKTAVAATAGKIKDQVQAATAGSARKKELAGTWRKKYLEDNNMLAAFFEVHVALQASRSCVPGGVRIQQFGIPGRFHYPSVLLHGRPCSPEHVWRPLVDL